MLLPREQPLKLYGKEREVCDLVIEGMDTAEIAARLHIAERTVKGHLARIYERNGIRSGIKRVKLAVYYYRETSQT